MEGSTLDVYDAISIVLSVGSAFVALISLYFSFLKRGQLVMPPVRMYRLDPRTFDSVRSLKITLPLTFMNTGAVQKVVPDLRISVKTGDGPLLFNWREELETLPIFVPRGQEQLPLYPFQPTLNPYESVAKVYGFETEAESSDAVSALDRVEGGTALQATIEVREGKSWKGLRSFTLRYAGRVAVEDRYDRINW